MSTLRVGNVIDLNHKKVGTKKTDGRRHCHRFNIFKVHLSSQFDNETYGALSTLQSKI